ncbi:NUDIX hydrolase [Kribbella flavida DSM 17836]|uniref:NUDIX hydrolase n=2 Tax=Kribbella flavida TaxID=182640 RepID=D2Q3R3_KRIFD|nr:NUDIX hydrolase [Kribbella flavida DSM 17836]
MRPSVQHVHQLVSQIQPLDTLEAEHRDRTVRWLESTDDIYRRAKPATPTPHLVAYVAVLDPADGSSLLVEHRNAGLWLPPGGHVEPAEDPADAAAREVAEELGIAAAFVDPGRRPAFVTVTETVGIDSGHTDVSLWFVVAGRRGMELTTDGSEFGGVRWWSPAEVAAAGQRVFDPHLRRFLTKVAAGTPVRMSGSAQFTAFPQERHAEVAGRIRRLER